MAGVAEEIAALRGTRSASLKDLLTHPSFSRLWRAMLVSSLGDWVGFVAVTSLVARLGGGTTAAGFAVAAVMVARLLPFVLFGAFAGVFVDRFDRRKTMVIVDLSRGALYASMPFMPGLIWIFLLSFVIETLSLVWMPAKDASVPNMVPRRQLNNANSVGLVTAYGTFPLGATIYTVLAGIATGIGGGTGYLSTHPESLALWLDAGTFLFSAWMIWGLNLYGQAEARVRAATRPKLSFSAALSETREGLRFLAHHPLVRAMTVGICTAFVGVGALMSLGPVFAQYTLDSGATGFGILMIALGLGLAAGMGVTAFASNRVERDDLFGVALLAGGICMFFLALMPSIGPVALFTVPMGAGGGIAYVTAYTMLQENVTDEFRGRTFGTLNTLVRIVLFVSLAVCPAVAAAIGVHTVVVAGHSLDLSGTRVTLWLVALLAMFGGISSRAGLKRHRIARPKPLSLIPRIRRAEGSGVFVAFEGVEGSGKGTQVGMAKGYVESLGRGVLVTREPGGTELGDRLRETVLDPQAGSFDSRAEALLFAASRAQHVSRVIRPALSEGKVVLCDRFVDSSLAYQGIGRGLGEHDVLLLNTWATQGLFPDLVILLNMEPEAGLARAEGVDRIESEGTAFHAKVADAYLKIAEEHPERVVVVDAAQSVDAVHKDVCAALDRVLKVDHDGRGEPPEKGSPPKAEG